MDLSCPTSPGEAPAAGSACGEAKVCGLGIQSSGSESGICWAAVTPAHDFTYPCLRFVICAS